jgi:hypothetical protein
LSRAEAERDGRAGHVFDDEVAVRARPGTHHLIAFTCALNQFVPLMGKRGLLPARTFLLEGDAATLGLLRTNPFPARPPRYLRAKRRPQQDARNASNR